MCKHGWAVELLEQNKQKEGGGGYSGGVYPGCRSTTIDTRGGLLWAERSCLSWGNTATNEGCADFRRSKIGVKLSVPLMKQGELKNGSLFKHSSCIFPEWEENIEILCGS